MCGEFLQSTALSDSLHPILDYIAHESGGFNIFRRFRLTHLEKSDCPERLKHFWSGHAPKHVSEGYIKLAEDRGFRLMPMALEYVDRDATTRPLNLQFHNESVRRILEGIIRQAPEFRISFAEGLVDIFAPQRREDTSNLLNRVN
jgi:hypothetical protein